MYQFVDRVGLFYLLDLVKSGLYMIVVSASEGWYVFTGEGYKVQVGHEDVAFRKEAPPGLFSSCASDVFLDYFVFYIDCEMKNMEDIVKIDAMTSF